MYFFVLFFVKKGFTMISISYTVQDFLLPHVIVKETETHEIYAFILGHIQQNDQ